MLDNLQFDYEPNDFAEEYVSAYDLRLMNGPQPRDIREIGHVLVFDDLDTEAVAHLFTSSPELLSTVRRFVQWADNQPVRPRPNLDPIVADARALLARLDD